MKQIEPLNPGPEQADRDRIRDFWTRNVNAEKLFGKPVSEHPRGEAGYFEDLETQRYRSHRHLLPWIRQMRPGASVLEIGCGVGMDSLQMARHGLRVTGIDLTEVAVETAAHRFATLGLDAAFSTGDATALQFDDDCFDYVYSFGVLHHCQDTEQSIREVYRVLRPGGTALIMLYNRHSLNELVHRLSRVPFEDRNELCPVVRRFTRAEVRAMFAPFSSLSIGKDFVYGEGYGALFRLTPGPVYRALSRTVGWHLMITGVK
jgi:ubiquinone/menaquinone biosynthesis C-methylase UbiE